MTHQMRHVRLSRSFIGPEVGLHAFLSNPANALTELLMAQGVIIGHSVDAGISGGSEANDKKRVRDDDRSPGPSKRRTGPTVKSEEDSADTRAQRIQALQVSRDN